MELNAQHERKKIVVLTSYLVANKQPRSKGAVIEDRKSVVWHRFTPEVFVGWLILSFIFLRVFSAPVLIVRLVLRVCLRGRMKIAKSNRIAFYSFRSKCEAIFRGLRSVCNRILLLTRYILLQQLHIYLASRHINMFSSIVTMSLDRCRRVYRNTRTNHFRYRTHFNRKVVP
jgi:hypothetical protein